MRNLALVIAMGLGIYALSQSDKPTTPVVTDTKPIVPIPQPEPAAPIGSDEPIIEDEPQAEPEVEPAEVEPAPAPTYRATRKVWVRTGWRRGHWEWR